MSRPTLIHSFNTRPLAINCYDTGGFARMCGNIWYFALSMAYVRALGARIELHTDSLGERLLGFLPYDSVHLTLDAMDADISPRFWAAGKVLALEAAAPGSIHIDGDVFIKKGAVLEAIEARPEAGLVVQHREPGYPSYGAEAVRFKAVGSTCADCGIDLADTDNAYNTGFVGFRSQSLLRRWAEAYRTVACAYTAAYRDQIDTDAFAGVTPDLITEQLAIFQLARAEGVEACELLGDRAFDRAFTGALGYQHVPTMHKFTFLPRVKAILRARFPEIYTKTSKICPV